MSLNGPVQRCFTTRVYPTREDILAEKIYHCPIGGCDSTFRNASNMQMHITRHHRTAGPATPQTTANDEKQFFCPTVNCSYYQTPSQLANGARCFPSLRRLKQHYLKMHGERTFACEACGKSFATASYLRHHRQSCGQTFECAHCSFTYGSREALLTHAKRKNHGYAELLASRKLPLRLDSKQMSNSISTATQTPIVCRADQTTQTIQIPPVWRLNDSDGRLAPGLALPSVERYGANADTSLSHGSTSDGGGGAFMYPQARRTSIDGAESFVVCTQTQTDIMDVMTLGGQDSHDPLLSYTHMYTQTSDDPGLCADLGLSTIETQTSWSDGGEGFGEYLVSTETQTNFDIDSFSCGSNCNDKIDQAVQCQQPALPYL